MHAGPSQLDAGTRQLPGVPGCTDRGCLRHTNTAALGARAEVTRQLDFSGAVSRGHRMMFQT
jgi:hypothetical protein